MVGVGGFFRRYRESRQKAEIKDETPSRQFIPDVGREISFEDEWRVCCGENKAHGAREKCPSDLVGFLPPKECIVSVS